VRAAFSAAVGVYDENPSETSAWLASAALSCSFAVLGLELPGAGEREHGLDEHPESRSCPRGHVDYRQ
jgi:hypothetical protein